MSSEVYFRFKANIKQDTIQFDGSAISVKDLKSAIKTKCCLRTGDFDLKLEDSTGKEYTKESELIPKYTNVIVKRVPKASGDSQRKKPQQNNAVRDKNATNTTIPHSNSVTNLADSNLSEDEKIKIMYARTAENLNSKYYTVKPKAYGVPPPHYVCHKCNQGGHWIHECPGIKDSRGNLLDSKSVKRPTGIPQDFLVRVEPGTPGAYLDKNGQYMVPIKDAEAYLHTKKDKTPFSIEENPPYIPPEKPVPSEGLLCPLCKNICKAAVLVTCCGTSYCSECITNYCFVDGHHKCPNCGAPKEKLETSIVENASLRRAIEDFLLNEGKPEVSNSPIASKPITEVKESENTKPEIVRRVLKPKQHTATASGSNTDENQEEKSEDQQETQEETKEEKKDASPRQAVDDEQSNVPQTTTSSPSVTVKSDSYVNKQSESFPSVISNTNSLVKMPCGNNSLETESLMSNLPKVTSIYNGPPLVFPGENAATLANLAALSSVGQSQPPLNPVFPANQLLPWATPMDQISLLGSINPGGFHGAPINPLLDARGKVLSKEEFYGIQRKYVEESKRRRRRSRSRGTPPRYRRDNSEEYGRRHRDYDRRIRRSPLVSTRRHRSRSRSGSDRRYRNRERRRDDYETWLRKKREAAVSSQRNHRPSPYRPPRSRSPVLASTVSIPRRDFSREASPHERNYKPDLVVDKSRLRSPFHVGSPSRRSLEDVSPVQEEISRPESRIVGATSEMAYTSSRSSRRRSLSDEGDISVPQLSNPEAELDEKALKRLRKEQKKKAKRERKKARKLAKKASLEGGVRYCSSPSLISEASSKTKHEKKKKRKRKHKHEYSDSEAEDIDRSKKRSKSKRLTSLELMNGMEAL